jgi:hypothetical protein
MHEIAFALLVRAAALIAIMVVLTACTWLALKKLGLMHLDQPFTRTDLRTWPLSFALVDAVIYATIFAGLHAALGEDAIAAGASAAAAALICLQAIPAIIERRL